MDTKKQLTKLATLHPAQLWIGPHETVLEKAITYLQSFFCKNNGCKVCAICHNIATQQYHAIMWLKPEKQYTIEQINTIHTTIAFELNQDEHFFIVLQKADFLSQASANKLLKSLEEPPRGYHFLLLAERKEQILPTIISRCIIKTVYEKKVTTIHPELYQCFTQRSTISPLRFMKILDDAQINERETRELLDSLISYWIELYKKELANSHSKEAKKTKHMCDTLTHAAAQPPMPGSSKLFWRNVFLQVNCKKL